MDHIEHGRAAFMGVNARLEAFYSKRAKKITVDNNGNQIEHEYQRQGGLLMWKNNGEWEVAVVANQGVISEAYVNFLFTRHDTAKDFLSGLEIGNPKYYSHNLIESFYKNYMSGVTNLAAIVEEDVIGEYAQYAVKAKKAALATPAQHLRVASTIVSSTSNISPKDLKKMIIDAFKKNSELAPLIKGTIKNSLTGEIKSIDKLGKIQKKMGSKGWISIDSSFDDFIKVIQDLIESEL